MVRDTFYGKNPQREPQSPPPIHLNYCSGFRRSHEHQIHNPKQEEDLNNQVKAFCICRPGLETKKWLAIGFSFAFLVSLKRGLKMIVVESLQNISLPTTDLKKSIEFYTLLFDFDLVEENESYAVMRFDNLNIKVVQGTAAQESNMPIISFILDVDDFTDALQELESNEIKIVTGPTETEKGENLMIHDPGGNLIELYYED